MPDNLFANLPAQLPDEVVEVLTSSGLIRIERIVSRGHASPPGFWYDQEWDEFVLLLTGAARLEFESGNLEMKPGDYLLIPAHRRHRVAWTDPATATVWLAVHYAPPRAKAPRRKETLPNQLQP